MSWHSNGDILTVAYRMLRDSESGSDENDGRMVERRSRPKWMPNRSKTWGPHKPSPLLWQSRPWMPVPWLGVVWNPGGRWVSWKICWANLGESSNRRETYWLDALNPYKLGLNCSRMWARRLFSLGVTWHSKYPNHVPATLTSDKKLHNISLHMTQTIVSKRLIWGRVKKLEHPRSVVNLRAIFKKII